MPGLDWAGLSLELMAIVKDWHRIKTAGGRKGLQSFFNGDLNDI